MTPCPVTHRSHVTAINSDYRKPSLNIDKLQEMERKCYPPQIHSAWQRQWWYVIPGLIHCRHDPQHFISGLSMYHATMKYPLVLYLIVSAPVDWPHCYTGLWHHHMGTLGISRGGRAMPNPGHGGPLLAKYISLRRLAICRGRIDAITEDQRRINTWKMRQNPSWHWQGPYILWHCYLSQTYSWEKCHFWAKCFCFDLRFELPSPIKFGKLSFTHIRRTALLHRKIDSARNFFIGGNRSFYDVRNYLAQ